MGIDVWILTSRYDELHKHRYSHNVTHDELYNIAHRLGIPKHNIRFTCMRDKAEYLYGTNVIWHLDDDYVELNSINQDTKTVGISVNSNSYIKKM